jgi:hypothetical protein
MQANFSPIFLLYLVAFSIVLSSCAKDNLKKPVKLTVDMKLMEESPIVGRASFYGGKFPIKSLELTAKRKIGDDIIYRRIFDEAIVVDLQDFIEKKEFDFYLPVGEYQNIELICKIGMYLSDTPSLKGEYLSPIGGPTLLQFDYEDDYEFRFVLEDTINLLEKINTYRLQLIFNPSDWFIPVYGQTLMNATTSNIGGVNITRINRNENFNIFSIIEGRMNEFNTVSF